MRWPWSAFDDYVIEPWDKFDRHVPARYQSQAPKSVPNDQGVERWQFAGTKCRPQDDCFIDSRPYEIAKRPIQSWLMRSLDPTRIRNRLDQTAGVPWSRVGKLFDSLYARVATLAVPIDRLLVLPPLRTARAPLFRPLTRCGPKAQVPSISETTNLIEGEPSRPTPKTCRTAEFMRGVAQSQQRQVSRSQARGPTVFG